MLEIKLITQLETDLQECPPERAVTLTSFATPHFTALLTPSVVFG